MPLNMEMLMNATWEKKGCEFCRGMWEAGKRLPELAVNISMHSRLHQRTESGAYWEQHERFADIIAADDARALYPEAFA